MFKKSLFFLCLSFFALSSFAQYSGTITVSSNSNQKFWLFVDDVLQNEYATNAIQLQGLQFTNYRVRVEMDNRDYNCVGQTVLISNMPNNNNYVINTDRGNYYFMNTKTPINPFFIQNIIVPNNNYYSSYQQYLYPGFNPNANYGQGNQYKGSQYKGYQQYYQGGGYGNNQGYPPGIGGNSGYGNNSGYPPIGGGNSGYGNPTSQVCMPSIDFNRALNVIKQEKFDNSKVNTAKQITASNYLCVNQIVQICKQFEFDNSKLDFAKFAYRYCADQYNYYLVNEVFMFDSSKNDLRKYIEGR